MFQIRCGVELVVRLVYKKNHLRGSVLWYLLSSFSSSV